MGKKGDERVTCVFVYTHGPNGTRSIKGLHECSRVNLLHCATAAFHCIVVYDRVKHLVVGCRGICLAIGDGAHVLVFRWDRDVGCVLVAEFVQHLADFQEVGPHFGVLNAFE
jgi:hypothetical protein